ncbi:MAG: IS4 family transposase, partial [Leadbetterella sp.]
LTKSDTSLGFPRIFKDQYQLKAFYRLIGNDAISHSTFLDGYKSGLKHYAKNDSLESAYFLIQDTMLTDFNTRKVDLGYTQTLTTNGIILHNGLLLNEQYVPLGLLHQEIITRDRAEFGKSKDFRIKTIDQKESNKWLNCMRSGENFTNETGRKLIHVMDREADIVELMNLALSSNQYFVIRARHDRSTLSHKERSKIDSIETFRLSTLIQNGTNTSQIIRTLRADDGKKYEAECKIAFQKFNFRGLIQEVTCVWIKELTDRENPVEWSLLTNLPVNSPQEAERIIEIYKKRWTIEDFHKCYKTGCKIEKRQFQSVKTLTTIIGMLGLLAIELLRTRYLATTESNTSIDSIIETQQEKEFIKTLSQKYLKPIDLSICEANTVLWWMLLLGRMGGHQGFKQKGLPGWQTIWTGYQYYLNLWEGYKMKNSS